MSSIEQIDTINIRGTSSNNGITTLLIGGCMLLVGILIMTLLPEFFFLVGILLVSASIIAFTMGYFKLKEPKHSMAISKQSIRFFHRRGEWQIQWDNVQRIDVPKVRKGLEHRELEMVGIRLKDPEVFLRNISPRLITYLLMEQRPLVLQIEKENCQSGKCYGDDLIEDQKYKLKDGSSLNGIAAMFANRMRRLKEGLGYDIFISVNELDRSPQAFVNLLRECHQSLLIKQ
ncbi:DUF2982 domain-containing protein [Glaciecola sp. 1036]|uniref:DUF2982 domain-containing protein n=1 Tax=Alteromonadaceae TaxID=72275 RepID=UPI003D01DF83